MPGRHGDILWALPTVRAIAETYGEPVTLQISAKYGSLAQLLARQDYIHYVYVDPAWVVEETAPMTPRVPPQPRHGDRVFHLGYEGWPQTNLAADIYGRAVRQAGALAPLGDWSRPWIANPYPDAGSLASDLCLGFTDEHFETKYGLTQLLLNHYHHVDGRDQQIVNLSNSPRWNREAGTVEADWLTAAAWLAQTRCAVACCSALHVLAVAVGTPVVVIEPAPARLQAVFWPLGFDGDRVQVVRGGDGLPTLDSRHLVEQVDRVQARRPAGEAR
jgi:hypothetical protein